MATAIVLVSTDPGKDQRVAQGLKKIKGVEGRKELRGDSEDRLPQDPEASRGTRQPHDVLPQGMIRPPDC
jgi:hypothetical protein